MRLARPIGVVAALVASAYAAPVLAQAPLGVQIYGRANVSYERITTKNSNNTAVQPNESNWDLIDNSSRIGVRGRKELTRGLFGHFQVESRVRLDEGFGDLSSRDSYAGLEGFFGNVRLGRTIGPVYYATYDYISLHNHDTGTSADALLAPAIFGHRGFMNNTVWYTSPKFGPFSVDIAHSLLDVERLPGESQPRYLGLVGSFDQGPLHVAASYATTKDSDDLDGDPAVGPLTPNDDKVYTIGGAYNMKVVVLGALFERAESATLTGDAKRNYVRVSAMVPVGQHELHANFGTTNGRLDTAGLSDDGARQWTLAYNYNITKETKVYAFYTTVNNDTLGNYGTLVFPGRHVAAGSPGIIPGTVPGVDIRSIALGVRHNF